MFSTKTDMLFATILSCRPHTICTTICFAHVQQEAQLLLKNVSLKNLAGTLYTAESMALFAL